MKLRIFHNNISKNKKKQPKKQVFFNKKDIVSIKHFYTPFGIFSIIKHFAIVFFLLLSVNAISQEKNWVINGYIKDMAMYYKPAIKMEGLDVDYLASNMVHNRLNFKWYASPKLTIALEARNRLFFGQMIKELPMYKSTIDIDNGFVDLSAVMASGNGWFLHSILDRAWIDYTSGNWQIRVGRQRINWGINMVWNPNDIFNSFSYFDFDYEERPGTDAVKIQYYTGVTSSAELVYKIGRNADETAIAGMYRFSQWNYDFQFFSGLVGNDFILGTGWAGDINGAGFRGEVSWFIPKEKNNGSQEALVASISADYTFKNSLYIHSGLLFNSHGAEGKAGGRSFFEQNLSAKMLSLAKYSVFAQTSFPVTPLFSVNVTGMFNPLDYSSFLGPAITYSLGDNLELMLQGQIFTGDTSTEYGDYGKAAFARLKWAF